MTFGLQLLQLLGRSCALPLRPSLRYGLSDSHRHVSGYLSLYLFGKVRSQDIQHGLPVLAPQAPATSVRHLLSALLYLRL